MLLLILISCTFRRCLSTHHCFLICACDGCSTAVFTHCQRKGARQCVLCTVPVLIMVVAVNSRVFHSCWPCCQECSDDEIVTISTLRFANETITAVESAKRIVHVRLQVTTPVTEHGCLYLAQSKLFGIGFVHTFQFSASFLLIFLYLNNMYMMKCCICSATFLNGSNTHSNVCSAQLLLS